MLVSPSGCLKRSLTNASSRFPPGVLASLLASLAACGLGARLKYFPVLPAVYAAYHFGYGIGFLRGLLAFRRRGGGEASNGFDAITR